MKSINIVECKNEDDLKEVAILAKKIWHEFFPGIISEAQIDYMVEQFQSFDAVQDQVKHQQYHHHKVYEGDEHDSNQYNIPKTSGPDNGEHQGWRIWRNSGSASKW